MPHSPSRNGISRLSERMQQQRRSPCLQQSLHLANMVTVWLVNMTAGNIQQSLHIAAIPPTVRDYLPAQRKIIALSCLVLWSGFKVHVPQQGAPGLLSFILLATTFTRFTHTVYGFLLGKQGGIWLRRDNESGRYCFGYGTWGFSPGRVSMRKIFATLSSGLQPVALDN